MVGFFPPVARNLLRTYSDRGETSDYNLFILRRILLPKENDGTTDNIPLQISF